MHGEVGLVGSTLNALSNRLALREMTVPNRKLRPSSTTGSI